MQFLSLTCLFGGWALVTFFPEGGFGTIGQAFLRAAVSGAAALGVALALSCPLRALNLIRWSPPYDLYVRHRTRRQRAREEEARERYERQKAPYRALESLTE